MKRAVTVIILIILAILWLILCPCAGAQTISDYARFTEKWEGRRYAVYTDPNGRDKAIGVGHKISPHEKFGTLNDAQIDTILRRDITAALAHARNNVKSFDRQPYRVKLILVDHAFQVGPSGQKSFKKMIDAVNKKDYITASKEMKDSKWYGQSGNRSRNHVEEMKK